jgi:hypothetical protein
MLGMRGLPARTVCMYVSAGFSHVLGAIFMQVSWQQNLCHAAFTAAKYHPYIHCLLEYRY